MALSLPQGGSNFSAEPNVVPMIDILLVLLIIFMMQIPLSRKAMDTQVPPEQREEQEESREPSQNIVLELTADSAGYAINGEPVSHAALDARFHAIYDNRPVKIMFLKAAPNRKYFEVIDAIDIARGAGVQVVGFTPPDPVQADQQ